MSVGPLFGARPGSLDRSGSLAEGLNRVVVAIPAIINITAIRTIGRSLFFGAIRRPIYTGIVFLRMLAVKKLYKIEILD